MTLRTSFSLPQAFLSFSCDLSVSLAFNVFVMPRLSREDRHRVLGMLTAGLSSWGCAPLDLLSHYNCLLTTSSTGRPQAASMIASAPLDHMPPVGNCTSESEHASSKLLSNSNRNCEEDCRPSLVCAAAPTWRIHVYNYNTCNWKVQPAVDNLDHAKVIWASITLQE